MKLLTSCLFLVFITSSSWSQVTNEGAPKSWDKSVEIKTPKAIEMPSFDLQKLQEEDALTDGTGTAPWRFGFDFVVDYNLFNNGEWTVLDNGDRIWQLRIKSEGAKTLNFVLDDFFMPKGASLYLFSFNQTDLLGAYDEQQNNENNSLGTWLVQGDDVVLEYFEPKNVEGQGRLAVAKVVHGYRTQNDFEKGTNGLNDSGNCNLDVDCSIGTLDDLKNHNKKSVALLLSNNNSFCSGALVNNTSNDGKRYILTANHCYSNPANWAFRFNWISENPVCATTQNSPNNTNYNQTISGATLRARRGDSDFCLVEVNNAFPTNWDLVWAGWDRGLTPATSSFGIHHPSGDIMKTCLDNNAPISLNLTNGDRTWEVSDWDLGVTEGGSSGSPLFNQNGLITGQLWRGGAACNGTTDNNLQDEYGRLNVSWDAGSTASTRLKEWLDPSNTGVETLQPFPSLVSYPIDASVSVQGVPTTIFCDNFIEPQIKLSNFGTNTLTAATVSYSVNGGIFQVINWEGNLLTGEFELLEIPAFYASNGSSTIDVSVTDPNNTLDDNPSNDMQNLTIDNTTEEFPIDAVIVSILMDDYANEVSWDIKNEDDSIIASSPPYNTANNNQQINETVSFPQSGCYTFTMYDTEGDGICCNYGTGNYSLLLNDGTVLTSGGNYQTSESYTFKTNSLSAASSLNALSLQLYPNPANDKFYIKTNGLSSYVFAVYSVLGQEIMNGNFKEEVMVNSAGLSAGVYIVEVEDLQSGQIVSSKIVLEN